MQQEDFDTLIKLYVIINCKPSSNAYRQHLKSGALSSRWCELAALFFDERISIFDNP